MCKWFGRGGCRHLIQVLTALTDAASLPPTTGKADVATLLPVAYGFAKEVYPSLLGTALTSRARLGGGFLARTDLPACAASATGRAGRVALAVATIIVLTVLAYTIDRQVVPVLLLPWVTVLGMIAGVSFVAALIGWPVAGAMGGAWALATVSRLAELAAGFWRGLRQLFSPRSDRARPVPRPNRWPRFFSVRYGLAPGGLGLLLEDDERFAVFAAVFGRASCPICAPLL